MYDSFLGELPGLGCDVRVLRAVLPGITGLSWHSMYDSGVIRRLNDYGSLTLSQRPEKQEFSGGNVGDSP